MQAREGALVPGAVVVYVRGRPDRLRELVARWGRVVCDGAVDDAQVAEAAGRVIDYLDSLEFPSPGARALVVMDAARVAGLREVVAGLTDGRHDPKVDVPARVASVVRWAESAYPLERDLECGAEIRPERFAGHGALRASRPGGRRVDEQGRRGGRTIPWLSGLALVLFLVLLVMVWLVLPSLDVR